jgi:hypothetical protein
MAFLATRPISPSEGAAVKILIILAIGVLAVLFFTSACDFEFNTVSGPAQSSKKSVTKVSDLLDQATRAGDTPASGPASARLTNECAKREQRLARLPRPTGLTDIAPHAQRILAVLRAHSRRAARLGAPAQIQAFDEEQQRAVLRLARAARAGNYRAASRQATALRELAGRANTELLRLGLAQCAIRATAMPL